jgi:hypothetical protein
MQEDKYAQIQSKIQRGLKNLKESTGNDGFKLGMALVLLHGALEDFFRLELALKAPHLRSEVEDLRKTSWRELIDYGKKYLKLSENDAFIIMNANKLRQRIAHDGEYDGNSAEVMAYAKFVQEWCDETELYEDSSILQPKHSNDFRYILQKAIDLYAQTQKRNFADVLAEMDDQLGYGRNSHTTQFWLNESIVPNSAEIEYFAKKITSGTNLDSKWIRSLFDAAGYQIPNYLIQRSLHVFLCHAHNDSVAVRDIYDRLLKDDVDVWLDKEKLLPGSEWEYEIRKAVREADVVVVCLSKNFNQRGFRQKEVRLALDVAMEQPEGDIFIIPARLEECESLESLKKWHWVDLYEPGGYEKLIQALKARAQTVGASLK